MGKVHWCGSGNRQNFKTKVIKFLFILLICDRYLLASGQDGKIIGGRKAKQGEFPSTVCYDGVARCGGTLVTKDKVLTAGHCFNTGQKIIKASDVTIIAGIVNIKDTSSARQESSLKDYKIHEKFERRPSKYGAGDYVLYDIALATLKKAFVPTDTVKPMVFPAGDPAGMKAFLDKLRTQKSVLCHATGFGVLAMEGADRVVSDDLKVAEVNLLPQIECRTLPEMKDFEICGSSVKSDEQTSPGDSGSTFLCDGKFVGIVKGSKSFEFNGKQIVILLFTLAGPSMDHLGLTGLVESKGNRSMFELHPIFLVFVLISSRHSWI